MFFPIRMILLRMGMIMGVALVVLFAIGLTSIPPSMLYFIIQTTLTSLLIFGVSLRYKDTYSIFKCLSDQPLYILMIACGVYACVTFLKLVTEKREPFIGNNRSTAHTNIRNAEAHCLPELNFDFEQKGDGKMETQDTQNPSCLSVTPELTEDEKYDKVDIYLRDSQESITRILKYLNTANPDERWKTKKEMEMIY